MARKKRYNAFGYRCQRWDKVRFDQSDVADNMRST